MFKIARIDIGEVLKDSQSFEILPIPKTDHHMTFVHYISDRYIIGTPSQGGIMTILDLMNGESNLVLYLPELEFNVHEFSLPTTALFPCCLGLPDKDPHHYVDAGT